MTRSESVTGLERVRRVAVYGEIDPNLVDGSSIWLQSICQVLAVLPDVRVTLMLRRPLEAERRFLLEDLEAHERITLVDAGRPSLLDPADALGALERLDLERGPFDAIVIRGQAVLAEVAKGTAFAGRLWAYPMTGRGMPDEILRRLAARSSRLLCQTDAVAEELLRIAPGAASSILVLPPMIPEATLPPDPERSSGGPLRLVYSGKLAPEYCWLETVTAFERLRRVDPAAELHVLGDKVHRPPGEPGFHREAMRALTETPGLRWHGAVRRSEVGPLLAAGDLALSIRDPSVEGAREVSTKVIEYGAAGLPVVLNRAPVYEALFGTDYPFFIDHPDEAAEMIAAAASDPAARATAAAACAAASREFTFARVSERLAAHLPPGAREEPGSRGMVGVTENPARVLIAGHDLKFVGPIREAVEAGGTVLEDVWSAHADHDEAASLAALAEAEVILCEWCLGNAAWYSRNKLPGQRLVIRLHRVEVETDYPATVAMENVDQVVFVSRHIADEAIERFGWDPAKATVIPNAVDVDRFHLTKVEEAEFTLAMVGYVPGRKRLDLALDVLAALRREEPRFNLVLVGQPPSELGWVARDPAEIEFFRACYSRIEQSDELRGAVEFRPFSRDLPQLFRRAGFVLSTSDSEGHQVALAEGAASGAIPVILDRPGVASQYQRGWIHDDPSTAAAALLGATPAEFAVQRQIATEHASRWAPERVRPRWLQALGLNDGEALTDGGDQAVGGRAPNGDDDVA